MSRSWKTELRGGLFLLLCGAVVLVSCRLFVTLTGVDPPGATVNGSWIGSWGREIGGAPALLIGWAAAALEGAEASPLLFCAFVLGIPCLVLRFGYVLLGGAVLRSAAEYLSRAPRTPGSKHFRFARQRCISLFVPPLALVAGAAVLLLITLAVSLLGRVPVVGIWLLVLVSPLLIVLGSAAATLVLGLFWSAPMMLAAVAVEGRGLVDALSRGFHYTFARPVSYALLSARGLLFAVLGSLVRGIFAAVILLFGTLALSLAGPADAVEGSGKALLWWIGFSPSTPAPLSPAHWALGTVGLLVLLTVPGHLLTHRATHQALTYLYLREETDGTPPHEVPPELTEDDDREHPPVTPESVGLQRVS